MTLRDEIIPEAFAGSQAGVYVTGFTAASMDFRDSMYDSAPYVFGFVLGLAFLLLLVMFRSIVIPVKAIVLNLLSVGAAYGVVVMVFQWGWGVSLLGSESTTVSGLAPPVPVPASSLACRWTTICCCSTGLKRPTTRDTATRSLCP